MKIYLNDWIVHMQIYELDQKQEHFESFESHFNKSMIERKNEIKVIVLEDDEQIHESQFNVLYL